MELAFRLREMYFIFHGKASSAANRIREYQHVLIFRTKSDFRFQRNFLPILIIVLLCMFTLFSACIRFWRVNINIFFVKRFFYSIIFYAKFQYLDKRVTLFSIYSWGQ